MNSRSKPPRKTVRGAGGGGDAPSGGARVDRDTLRSKAYVRIIDLISEGEIVGLVNGARSIYLNETPLVSADGSVNFHEVTWDVRNGTQDQSYIPGFSSVENEVTVNAQVKHATGGEIVRQITNTDVSRVRVRIVMPQLTVTDADDGDVHGGTVQVSIWAQPSGGSYQKLGTRVISGKSSSRYEVTLEVALPSGGPWNLKIVRDTVDFDGNAYVQAQTYVAAYVEIVEAKLRYPNSAIVGMRIDSEHFSSIPSRYYDVKLLKIRIPSNYNPITRVYTGSWDGTFQVAWSDNPAWVFYDLATSERYGLGAFIPEDQVDKWSLYSIARYCDELVSNGFGGTEPRFTCNMLIPDRSEAYTVLQSLASVFRGMIYWAAGTVTVSQDSPEDAAYLFTPANVVDGRFSYSGASAKVRHSVALVTWNDPADFYRPKVEYVEDQVAIAKFGVQSVEVVAYGCTSRAQAHRFGKWMLYTEQNESEVVSFRTGLEGIVGRPGQVIKIADPTRAGARLGGRVVSATSSHITVDQDLVGSISGNTLSVLLPTGAVEDRIVVGSTGRVIEVQPAFSQAPQSMGIWMLRSDAVEPQTFRVISIAEEDGGVFSITAVKHDASKYAAVEQNVLLEPKSYSVLRSVPAAPTNLQITESLYQSASEVRAKVTCSWDRVDGAAGYRVRYRRDNENFVDLLETAVTEADILDARPGTYTVYVTAVSSLGRVSPPASITKETYGKTAPPADVQGFSMIPNAGMAYLSWKQSADLDVIVGGQVRLRHTPLTTGQQWKNSIDIVPAVPGSSTSAVAPLLAGTYMAKFVDSSGNYSEAESIIVTTVPYTDELNVVSTITENPAFAGVKNGMTVDTLTGAMVLADTTLVDAYPTVDSVGNWDFPGTGTVSAGTYDFTSTFDLGAVYPARILSRIDLEAFDIGNVIDNRVNLIDTWQDIDGQFIDDVNAELYVRTTLDDPSGTPTWTAWKRISAGEYSARAFQFQLRCTSGTDSHNLYIRGLRVTVDMEDRALNLGPITSGTGATYRINYVQPFRQPPALAITANAMGSGDYYTITNSDETGFDIVFKNAAGTIVSRQFSVIAKGYGRKVA